MLVTLPQAMSVTEHFQLGRFGQVTLSQGGRLEQPTNVVAPGADAAALQASNNLRKIILDDTTQAQNVDPIVFGRGGQPLTASNTLRGGDTVTGLDGCPQLHLGRQRGQRQRLPHPPGLPGGHGRLPADQPAADEPARRRWRHPRRRDEPAQLLQHARHDRQQLPRRPHRGGHGLPRRQHRRRVRPPVAQDGRRRLGHAGRRRRLHGDGERRLRHRQRRAVPRRQAQREGRRRHVGVHRRRRPHGTARCPGQRRDQGRHALQAGRRHAGGHDGGAQHRRLRQRR